MYNNIPVLRKNGIFKIEKVLWLWKFKKKWTQSVLCIRYAVSFQALYLRVLDVTFLSILVRVYITITVFKKKNSKDDKLK